MSEPAILLDRLSKSYGDTDAVCDLSLTIAPGTIFGFLGANGAGKTTTIRMLCGLVHPTSGRAEITGLDVWRERQQARERFGYVAQRFSLYPVHRQQIWDLLYDLSNRGITIFVTTHYMDEAERCTEVGFIEEGRLLAKAPPRGLKESFQGKLLEIDVEPVMPALVRLREVPGILGVSLRSGSLRLYAADPEKLVTEWEAKWSFDDLEW